MAEFDRLGRSAFLTRFGFKPSTKFFAVYADNCYDTTAIVGAAHAFQFPEQGPLRPDEFSGGMGLGQADTVFQALGFDVVEKLAPESVRGLIETEARSSGGKLGGGKTVHKAVLLRHLLAQLGPDSERLTSTVEIASAIGDNLASAMPDLNTTNPHQPIWRIDNSLFSLIDDTGADPRPPGSPGDPQAGLLNSGACRGGFAPEVFVTLRDNPSLTDDLLDYLNQIIDGNEPAVSSVSKPDSQTTYGAIDGIEQGQVFEDRRALVDAGLHRGIQAGIIGPGKLGAESIVVSGGYADDEDHGDVIIYTGHGGRDPNTRRQVADQELTRGNLALAVSCDRGIPVRVIRGSAGDPAHSPANGFVYSGLYTVTDYWEEIGRDGFKIQRFRLERHPEPQPPPVPRVELGPADRISTTTQRIVRNTVLGRNVKELHDFTCQICEVKLETVTGGYAEAAHIQPLGSPHDGPDTESNLLCLCANCHVRFDKHAIGIEDDLSVWDRLSGARLGQLRTHPRHQIDPEYLRYHRDLYRS